MDDWHKQQLIVEAVGGSQESLQQLWVELIPNVKRIASGAYRRGQIGYEHIDDMSQELLAAVPKIIGKLAKRMKIGQVDEDNVVGWLVKAMIFESRAIAETSLAFSKTKSIHTAGECGRPLDVASTGFDSFEDIDCAHCGEVFSQRKPDQMVCGKCTANFARDKEAMLKGCAECEQILGLLRSGSELDSLDIPTKLISQRVALLRCMGFVIRMDANYQRKLISEPSDTRPFAHRFALVYYAAKSPLLSCWECDNPFTFSGPRNAGNHCSKSCMKTQSARRRRNARKGKIQAESPSCYSENAGCCGSHR